MWAHETEQTWQEELIARHPALFIVITETGQAIRPAGQPSATDGAH